VRCNAKLATYRRRHTQPREGAAGSENSSLKTRLTRQLPCKTPALSPKEIEVVRLFVQGQSGREIATRLSRSEKTISRQKRTAMNKLGLRHDCALMEWAAERGLRA
ncbi:hypothetical protein HBN61_22410, partial [Pseudomonas sp. WS 5071]|nr:hypothetical protein [Pseudomonas sp. WS 5071]